MQTILRDSTICLAFVCDGINHTVIPKWLVWQNWHYHVFSLNIIYTERRGIKKVHVFAVNVGPIENTQTTVGTLDMLIEIDPETLLPTLIMVSDGLAD